MATLTAEKPKLVSSPEPMETAKLIAKNGVAFAAGEFLRVDTSGYLVAVTTDVFTNTGGAQYYALADQADPGNTTTYAEVGVITEDMVWEGNELDGTVSAANIGQEYGLDVSSNVTTVDTAEVTNLAVTIVDVGPNWDPSSYIAADVKGKVRFKINADIIAAARAA